MKHPKEAWMNKEKRIFSDQALQRLFSDGFKGTLQRAKQKTSKRFSSFHPNFQKFDPLHQMLYADIKGLLPSDMLTKLDRVTMMHSLEARSPFLDYRLFEWSQKIQAGWKRRGKICKYILRKTMEDILPRSILSRKKMGFSIPLDIWLWKPGKFRDTIYDVLLSKECQDRGFFNHSFVRRLLNEHDRMQRLNGNRIWTCYVFEQWCRHWLR